MADVRALLKAKTKERQQEIQHPLAVYNAAGQLRCSLCGTLIKFASGWKTHLDSKGHKTNEAKEAEKLKKGKRKADVDVDVEMQDVYDDGAKKRKVDSPNPEAAPAPNGFPSDFFSDPGRSLPQPTGDDDDELATDNPPTIDDEWAAFERAMKAPPKAPSDQVYQNATVFAEPELVTTVPDGFPPSITSDGQISADGAPAISFPSRKGAQAPEGEEEEAPVETEAQIRKRKEQEEKELIMDRLLDEERAQEDADDKVKSLKARLAAIKLQREAKRKAKEKA